MDWNEVNGMEHFFPVFLFHRRLLAVSLTVTPVRSTLRQREARFAVAGRMRSAKVTWMRRKRKERMQ